MNAPDNGVITRFAPSPTGMLHLGNVRTALLNYLYAKACQGQFVLRFEDTDQTRSADHFMAAIMEDLQWLGLQWDGDIRFQRAHADAHQQALQQLADEGLAYPCFCSEHQLSLDRKLATSRGLPPRYSGRCRQLGSSERQQRMAQEAHVWRLAIHQDDDSEVVVPDLLRQQVHFRCRDLDDPIVVRSDGSFTFLLPNAIDDALDGITHALRGDDHLTNSAYQVWLLERLGHRAPRYAHHGLLLGADGAKLSKRTGGHEVAALRQAGLLPQALVQTMARLGHPNMPEQADSPAALAAHFHVEQLSTASVRWHDEAMWRLHSQLLHRLPPERFAALLPPLPVHLDESRKQAFAALIQANIERAEQASMFFRLLDATQPLDDAAMRVLQEAGKAFFQQAAALWHEHAGDWKGWTQAVRQQTGRKGRALFLPLRIALSGACCGPEMHNIIAFLGVQGVQERLRHCVEIL